MEFATTAAANRLDKSRNTSLSVDAVGSTYVNTPSPSLRPYASSCEISPTRTAAWINSKIHRISRVACNAYETTSLKHRFGRLGVGNYTVAFLTRFALSFKNSPTRNRLDKFRNSQNFARCLQRPRKCFVVGRRSRLDVCKYAVASFATLRLVLRNFSFAAPLG